MGTEARAAEGLDTLHRDVTTVVLRAAAVHGFALAGGNALMAHRIICRPTQDVDCFTDRPQGVRRARPAVERGLARAGFGTQRVDPLGGLADLFPGAGDDLAEWVVTAPGGAQTVLQMGFFTRIRRPVLMDVGPVLSLPDVLGSKVCALLGRAEVRDYADVAAALGRFERRQLLGVAARLDRSAVTRASVTAACRRLDGLSDRVFARYGFRRRDVAVIRQRFAPWPR